MHRRTLPLFLLAILLALLLLPQQQYTPAKAAQAPYFTFSLDTGDAKAGDLVRLRVQARDTALPAAGFRAQVFYDSDRVAFLGTETSSKILTGTLETNTSANPVCGVYVCNTDKGYAPGLSGTVLSFVFQVKEGAPAGEADLEAQIDEICDYDGLPIDADSDQSLSLRTEAGPSSEAYLTALVPSEGRLSPKFSPDEQDYQLDVGSDIDSVLFDASAAEGGTVKVSRKTLHAAGTETPIVVTVTSADESESILYQITVRREAAPGSNDGDSSKAAVSGSGKPASRSATGGSASSRTEPQGGTSARPSTSLAGPPAVSSAGGNATLPQAAQAAHEVQQETASRPNLLVVGDQMPPFLTGLLAAAFCIAVGVCVSLWLSRKPKQP